MKTLLAISAVLGGLFLHAGESNKLYVIEKVNAGTHFLKPGQDFAGFLTNKSVCGAKPGGKYGAEECAVVTPCEGQQGHYYYLQKTYVTGTPGKNLVGFIKGSFKDGPGIGGTTATGVYKAE
jgi:hypothetical protein